jgi:hypothetical protein
MTSMKRLSYITKSKLRLIATCYNKYHEKSICFLPICKTCKKWLMHKVAVYQGFGSWRFMCLNCYIKYYGKDSMINMLKNHISKLSKNREIRKMYNKILKSI